MKALLVDYGGVLKRVFREDPPELESLLGVELR